MLTKINYKIFSFKFFAKTMAEEARMGDHGTDSKCHVMVTRSETGVRQRKTICLKFCGFCDLNFKWINIFVGLKVMLRAMKVSPPPTIALEA